MGRKKSSSEGATSKPRRTRVCGCRLCHYSLDPIPESTWRNHKRLLEAETAGPSLSHLPLGTQDYDLSLSSHSDTDLATISSNVATPTSSFHIPTTSSSHSIEIFSVTNPAPGLSEHPMNENNLTLDNYPYDDQSHDSHSREPNSHSLGDPDNNTGGGSDEPEFHVTILQADQQLTNSYIMLLENAKLENSLMSAKDISALRNPPTHPTILSDNPSLKYSLKYYLDTLGSSRETYNQVIKTSQELQAELGTNLKFLSHYQIEGRAQELAGVATVVHDMCPKACLAYTGPLKEEELCPTCGISRWNPIKLKQGKKVPAQTFTTITLGSQLQALYSTPNSAKKMHYRRDHTFYNSDQIPSPTTFEDYIHGSDYLKQVHEKNISPNDILLMLSLDGAQLYEYRASDCWIYIWVIMELSPHHRYKKIHVLPGGVIPGPHKPQNVDSFLFPGLYHLAALQLEGLKIWDSYDKTIFIARPLVIFGTADAPGMVYLSGLVGHSGAKGCRNYCTIPWRLKPGGSHYYPILKLPNSYHSDKCPSFPDIDLNTTNPFYSQHHYNANLLRVFSSGRDYKKVRRETGISKASIFSGLVFPFGTPGSFPLDTMHLLALNIPDLLLGLWRGTIRCDTENGDNIRTWDWAVFRDNEMWKKNGALVAQLSTYLPSSYDRPPRNPAEKLTSGYKATEFMVYIYGFLPALLQGILPDPYLSNFLKLVRGVRLICQYSPTLIDIQEAHKFFIEFLNEFEDIYVQRKISRMHFVRQCMHTLWHLAPEAVRLGPPCIYAQWTMERAIGILGQEIRLHSNPYSNLSQIAIERCVVNSLYTQFPELDKSNKSIPKNAIPLENECYLLHPHQTAPLLIEFSEKQAIHKFERNMGYEISNSQAVCRHARLRLPNGQTIRTAWREDARLDSRTCRMVKLKICDEDTNLPLFGEVLYLFRMPQSPREAYAMISLASVPDSQKLTQSFGVLWLVSHVRHQHVEVVDIRDIDCMVAFLPFGNHDHNQYFIMEEMKLGVMQVPSLADDLE